MQGLWIKEEDDLWLCSCSTCSFSFFTDTDDDKRSLGPAPTLDI